MRWIGCSLAFVLVSLFAALTYFEVGSCRYSKNRLERPELAIELAEQVLLQRFQPDSLKIARSAAGLVEYMKSHPNCCHATKQFWLDYLDYVWFVDIYLSDTADREERVRLMLDGCGHYADLWLLPAP
jgi:hypothetical protein